MAVELPPGIEPPKPEERTRKNQYALNRLQRAKDRTRVVELAAAGLTYEQIAQVMVERDAVLGKTEMGVASIVRNAMRKWGAQNSDNLAEYRQKKLIELEQLKRAIWPQAIQGDKPAIREAVKIIQAQAQMSGANAPQKHEHELTVNMGIEEHEVQAMEQAWLDSGAIEGEVVGE